MAITAMACRGVSARRLLSGTASGSASAGIVRALSVPSAIPGTRNFHGTPACRTDGVFRGLTDSRRLLPWIEAFKQQQEGKIITASDSPIGERDMSPKKMSNSYHRVILPLGRDPSLSDTYINSSGHIRLGTIFMDLDALSGIVVYKHTGPGVTTVTAALDRITIAHPLTEICDLEYSGQVTYASGRSSMEITCKVARARDRGEPSRPEDVLLTCTFTMVALDPATKRPTNVPPLARDTAAEEAVFRAGEAKARAKRELAKTSLLAAEPDDPESALIHRIWLRQLAYHDPADEARQPANVVAMARTALSTASIMQPQYRNRHQTMIFGGFHLKQTFELAFCCAASFAHARPTFISADPCTFRNPVPVGSVLYLTATVVYTDPPLLDVDGDGDGGGGGGGNGGGEPAWKQRHDGDPAAPPMTRVHVRVDSKVRDVEHRHARPTGQFNYTFAVPTDVRVLPHTYQEFMMYVDARRRVRAGDAQDRRDRLAAAEGVGVTEMAEGGRAGGDLVDIPQDLRNMENKVPKSVSGRGPFFRIGFFNDWTLLA
ncbi:putative acyl- thioester mitochondrial precursor [Rosellinia necatrix]|uniref:Putative acyl-thioester mitochondrial n=1 Tax=Rosellinia necatrix TaxID=77044 RepID=A0A1W2TSG1_ROSNE|nr:putative acyl- thioester mitochondrial precursor [Rosellinia necatrix]